MNKTEEKILKKVRRKIKNKVIKKNFALRNREFQLIYFQISAQESRRKKKDYVDALEKEIAKYVDENKALKNRMAAIEKNQK